MNVRNTIKNTIISHRVPRSMSSDVQLVITSDYFRYPVRSHLPLALASATVCHCMLLGASAP